MNMKVCLICSELFAWGKYGGFGRATRIIGRELVKRGVTVYAVTPRRENQRSVEILDGIKVLSYPFSYALRCGELFKACDADIYHSEQPSIATYLAQKAMPHRKHIVTFQDPKDWYDWLLEIISPSLNSFRSLMAWAFENMFLVTMALNRADGLYYCVQYLRDKIPNVYRIRKPIEFLPTPVSIPLDYKSKSKRPTVCFVGRWDRRKKPELFFQLAFKNPDIFFIAPGASQDKKWDDYLRSKYGGLPNLEMPGFIDQFSNDSLYDILSTSWILVNTSTREGLPNSFLEALAHKCALLSAVNPENLTDMYGYVVKNGDFDGGLHTLLNGFLWKEKGEAGAEYVTSHYELNKAINTHIDIYRNLLGRE
jgi:glycosyltransferase involved in cell wall biosynthesis